MFKKRNAILQHPVFVANYRLIQADERDRCFCRHDLSHFLDVARIAVILNQKEHYGLDEDLIYAAALLHDIGRHEQYDSGSDHALASAAIAVKIAAECGFSVAETESIAAAIRCHRETACQEERNLAGLLYRADKMSRCCFDCDAEPLCNWSKEKKRHALAY